MKSLSFKFATLSIVFSIAAGCSPRKEAATEAIPSADELKGRLQLLADSGLIAFGHHDDVAYGHGWKYLPDSSDVKNVVGDYPAVMDWDLGLIEWETTEQLDGVPFELIRAEAVKHNAKGGINTFSWHVRNPLTKGDSWDISEPGVIAKALEPGELNDTLACWIGRVADFLGSIKNGDGTPVPIVFRPWHEHSGNWFWWDAAHNSPEDIAALWRLTREIFDQKGIDNVVWAYSPDKIKDEEQYLTGYPGDEYVDILGADVYYWNADSGEEIFAKHISTTLGTAVKLAQERGKLVALTETGCESVKHTEWFTKVLWPNIQSYPISYVTVWRNAHDKPEHYYAPYPGHPAAADFQSFYSLPRTVFQADMESLLSK